MGFAALRHKRSRLKLLVLVGCAAVVLLVQGWQQVLVRPSDLEKVLDPAAQPDSGDGLNEALLQDVVRECVKREQTFIHVGPNSSVHASRSMARMLQDDRGHCPAMDVMLGAGERGIGMCTDVALYVVLWRARILPSNLNEVAYSAHCGNKTARLFLETMYNRFFSPVPGMQHVMLPNSEHLFASDRWMHSKVQVYLCKTRFCEHLVQKYVRVANFSAEVWYVGHTSKDPSFGTDRWRSRHRADYRRFLHVRGKSGLKHTAELLDCWAHKRSFPRLTIVGDMELTPAQFAMYKAARNIKIVPPPTILSEGHSNAFGEFRVVPEQDLQQLQLSNGIHICPSEREGFGHYINEARAASALVITTDHPPMNELVTPHSGVYISGGPGDIEYFSDQLAALAPLGNISVRVSPGAICHTVEGVLKWSRSHRMLKGRAARAAFVDDRRKFVANAMSVEDKLLQKLGRDRQRAA